MRDGIAGLVGIEPDMTLLAKTFKGRRLSSDQLSITEETVKSRVKSILSKLGAHDRTHAALIGLKRGIIEL